MKIANIRKVCPVWVIYWLFVFAFFGGSRVSGQGNPYKETLSQVSTISALLAGQYDGTVTFGELKKYGDFGVGTFNSLDGEMIALQGNFYRVRIDGNVYRVKDSAKPPFAAVTFFEPDDTFSVGRLNYDGLKTRLNNRIDRDFFYAIREDGGFDYVKTRSVIAKKPYRPLGEVVKNQAIFEMRNVRGTLVGIYCPGYVSGLNVGGHHFHFITDNRKAGGHLLAVDIETATVALDKTPAFNLMLPPNFSAGTAGEKDIERVEKDPTSKGAIEKTLTLVFDKDWPPFSYVENGSSKGFLIDVASAVADAVGIKIVPCPVLWSDAQEQLLHGKADLITGIGKSQERLKKYEFADVPSANIAVKLFVPQDVSIPSIAYFKGTLNIEKGSLYSKIVKTRYPDIPQALFPTERDSIIALARGEGEGCVGADLAMYYYVRKEGIKNIKGVGTPVELINIYFAARKGNEKAMSLWNRGFAKIKMSGKYDQLYRKWFVKELGGNEITRLIQAASEARTFAYAPYSHYTVGAAVLTASGKIYTGCNVENALSGLTASAVKVAVYKAVSRGETEIIAVANVLADGRLAAPTADERQIIYEFGKGILVILKEDSEYITKTIAELLPYPFDMNK